MKKISLLLVISMLFTAVIPAIAEKSDEQKMLEKPLEFAIIEANENTGQPRLTYLEGETKILTVDDLFFKDMNSNGKLDVYEDWRADIDDRVKDLVSQMNEKEKAGTVFCVSANLDTARSLIPDFDLTCMLFNLNGGPVQVTNTVNNLQAEAEKQLRLSIPMTFTSDREFNAFGGYIDKAHIAFGTANDPELAYKLANIYGKAMVAIGIHVTFEPYANEIGAQYGENPEHIASIVHSEVKGIEDSGFASCVKHWIGRGGDSSFGAARSVAQNFENWMVGWKAALSGGNEWVMTNCGSTGISNTVDVKWDKATMSYLRDELGFNGVVVSDWWPLGFGSHVTGVTSEGVDLAEMDAAWLYNDAMKNGVDMFGTSNIKHGTDYTTDFWSNWPDCIIEGLKSGVVEEDILNRSVSRILRFKFKKGLFENPYRVVEEALNVVASPEYAAEQWELNTNEALRDARTKEEVELAEKLQAKSAVLIKNKDDILPLAKGTKIYFESYSESTRDHYKEYLSKLGEVVDSIEKSDVVVGLFNKVDDSAEFLVDDAKAAEKPIILTLIQKANEYSLNNADAVIYMPYSQKPDHGTGEEGFIYDTEPWVYSDLLFGVREPEGIIQKEQARNSKEEALQWKDLAGDQGASPYVRLIVQALMMEDTENHASPNNYGNPLINYKYGMRYGKKGDFIYSCLILPQSIVEEETTNRRGQKQMISVAKNEAKAGEPFTVYCLLNNNGDDDIVNVKALVNDEVAAESIYTVCGDSWRVVQLELSIEEPGEYTIEIGGQVGTLTVV